MRLLKTDVAIIGAGTAGMHAHRAIASSDKSWLLIESGPYGTTCARTGCMPSKLLIAAAETAHRARRAGMFGVSIAPEAIRIDGRAVLERVRRERDRFTDLSSRYAESLDPERRLHGTARFIGPQELQLDDHTRVEAGAIIIAAGSKPIIPRELESLGADLLTSDNLFDLETLPESVAVFGTGAIGLELGQALSQLGVRVAFFNPHDILGPFTDPVVGTHFREVMSSDLDLTLGIQVTDVRVEGEGVVIRHRDAAGRPKERRFARVLAAVGRKPSLDALDLQAAGLKLDSKGLPEFSRATTQCGSSPIFLAGDIDGFRTILHEAVDEGSIAGANALAYPNLKEHARRTPLNIGFTYPQLAMVGKTFKEATEQGNIAIGEVSYSDQGRARVIGQNRGHVRVYADRESRRLIGAEMFGPGVEHTAHLLAWAIQQDATIPQLLRMPVYHPTVEEGIRTALRAVGEDLDVLKGCLPEDKGQPVGI